MTNFAPMRAALATALADPIFVRSPVLARLLGYLVDETINGNGKTLKSYSVAVDGLGKSPDFDSQVDTYARVLVARLRKALDTYYATTGAQQNQRLSLDSGSYEVKLVPTDNPNPPRTALKGHVTWQYRRLIAAGLVACLITAAVLIMNWRAESLIATERWQTSNFPFVEVKVNDDSAKGRETDLTRRMRQAIISNLDNYEGVRILYNTSKGADYLINVDILKIQDKYYDNIMVIDNRTNRLIWSNVRDMKFSQSDIDLSQDKSISNSLFNITHPTGIIHSNERKRKLPSDTPYGCWLQFTGTLQNMHSIGNGTIAECARDWHSAAPSHPLATAIYGWTLIDKSISQITESGRNGTIQNAINVLETAKSLNPNSPLLQVSAMRAYAFAGDTEAVHATADKALKLNPDNLDIQGVSGLMLALHNDPQGEVLLNKAISAHFNPPPWYFIGLFVSAMMREDQTGAKRSLDQLSGLQHDLPIFPILSAAYEAHSGQPARACAAWNQAIAMQPVLKIKPDLFFTRLPMAPEVRGRLQKWLAPLLAQKARYC